MSFVVKILSLLFFLFVGPAAAADTFETALRLAQNGAPQLALSRVERDQPDRADVRQWLKWEPLRLSLLNELNRPAEALERIEALPPAGVPAEVAQPVLWQGALAALRLGQGESAREFLSRLLWKFELAEPQYREARRLVIQSYMQEKRADEGYRAMLRYSQDYQPLSQNIATVFTDALLVAGAKAEAGTWLAVLDESSPLKLLVRLKSGLITPEQAVAEARAAMAPASVAAPSGKSSRGSAQNPEQGVKPAQPKTVNAAAFWTVIMHAAAMREDAALQVEAREQLLDLPQPEASAPPAADADELWQSYSALALQHGNQAHLLLGDDASWFGLAERLADASPAAARALFAYLALRATEPVRRESAQTKLTALLQSAKLERAAVRLFADAAHFPDNKGLSLPARHALGEAAAQGKDYVHAARLWRGLPQPPAGMPAEEWRLRLAGVFVYGGAYEEAVEAVRLLPGAETVAQRKILFALGELAEGRADAAPAADYYLLAAAQANDALAQKARFRAARSLERAGLRGDARKQYLMLLQTSPDASQQDDIRRALARL